MIDLRELRIGNYIKHNEEYNKYDYKGHFKVSLKMFYGITDCVVDVENLSYIPLTYKLVEKLGFVKDNTIEYQFSFKDYNFYLYQEELTFIQVDCDCVAIGYSGFEFLHQLQNRFYSITGIELMDVIAYNFYLERISKVDKNDKFGAKRVSFEEFVKILKTGGFIGLDYTYGDLPPNLFL